MLQKTTHEKTFVSDSNSGIKVVETENEGTNNWRHSSFLYDVYLSGNKHATDITKQELTCLYNLLTEVLFREERK